MDRDRDRDQSSRSKRRRRDHEYWVSGNPPKVWSSRRYHPSGMRFLIQWPHRIVVPIGGIAVDTSELELRPQGKLTVTVVKANDLKNMEMIGKSDPYVVVYIRPLFKVKTKVIDNDLNPIWNQTFELIAEDKETQSLILEIVCSRNGFNFVTSSPSGIHLEGVVTFFGRVAILIDQNTQAFHMFITALLQLLDRSGLLYGELARFVLRLLGIRAKPKKVQPLLMMVYETDLCH